MSLRIRRGTDTQRSSIVFDPGELAWCLDTRKLYVGDGLTPGGVNVLAYMAGVGVSFNSGTQALDFSQGNLTLTTANIAEDPSRLYYTDVRAKDAVGAMLQAGSNTGITFSYDSSSQAITVNSTGHQLPTASLPGDAGKYLTLDNSGNPVWHNPPIQGGLSLPSFGGTEIGKYLTTDGTYLVWADVAINSLVNGAFHVDLDSVGNLKTSGTIKLPSTADIVRETGVGTNIYTSVLGGLGSVSADTSPSLGGNLSAGGHNISNVGTLSVTTVSTGTISATTGLGANLALNNFNINGTGNIGITGNITATGSITANSQTGAITATTISATIPAITATSSFSPALYAVSSINPAIRLAGITDGQFNVSRLEIDAFKGTNSSKINTAAGDSLGGLYVRGYYNSTYIVAAGIIASWDATAQLNTSFPASKLVFFANGNGNNSSVATFDGLTGIFNVPVLKTAVYSVATTALPSASTVGVGARAFVTDAMSNSFGTSYTGGGMYSVPVYSDGSAWYIG